MEDEAVSESHDGPGQRAGAVGKHHLRQSQVGDTVNVRPAKLPNAADASQHERLCASKDSVLASAQCHALLFATERGATQGQMESSRNATGVGVPPCTTARTLAAATAGREA